MSIRHPTDETSEPTVAMLRHNASGPPSTVGGATPPQAEAAPEEIKKSAQTQLIGSGRWVEPLDFSSSQMTSVLALLAVATVFTGWFAIHVHDNKPTYPYGDLFTGQLMAFLVGFAVLTAAALYYGAALYAYATGAESSWAEACRRYLTDEHRGGLTSAAEFVLLLGLFFLCDRTSVVPRAKKNYDKDTFWFLWVMLCIIALFTLRRAKAPAPKPAAALDAAERGEVAKVVPQDDNLHVKWLQRDQTEEWKGWMQVMFLWYHYFNATDIYNAIRLYIAAYVWMTGFGNFSYYWVRKDFSLERFCQMQWRLNFLVLWVCLLMANEYMLYYINMLHTYFTLLIYVGLGIWSQHNSTTIGVSVKVAVLFAVCFVMWDVPGVFDFIWAPFTFLVQYHDPYKPTRPLLQEWEFRSGLDHYVWIFGMITAFNHPNVDAWMVKVDNMRHGMLVKFAATGALLAAGYVYVVQVFLLPKSEYNKVHPYTSFIPITIFILLRNLYPTLRRWHMHLFEYLGKITLETYIAQFHVWMATTGINGAPKRLLQFVPGQWPLVNFVVASAIFFVVSMRLFHNTNSLKAIVLPPKSTPEVLRRNLLVAFAALIAVYGWSMCIQSVVTRYYE
jgi:hypothetical protein